MGLPQVSIYVRITDAQGPSRESCYRSRELPGFPLRKESNSTVPYCTVRRSLRSKIKSNTKSKSQTLGALPRTPPGTAPQPI